MGARHRGTSNGQQHCCSKDPAHGTPPVGDKDGKAIAKLFYTYI